MEYLYMRSAGEHGGDASLYRYPQSEQYPKDHGALDLLAMAKMEIWTGREWRPVEDSNERLQAVWYGQPVDAEQAVQTTTKGA